MDRRSFVKTCIGVASAGALAASGLSIAAGLAIPRKPGGALIKYWGAQRVAGPAPRGLPYIPIAASDGKLVGRPVIPGPDGEEIVALDWYKYCGHAGAPGLKPDFTDNEDLTYFIAEEKLKSITPWFKDLLGQPIRKADFPWTSFGAGFTWRSEGQSGPNVISGVVMRVPKAEVQAPELIVPPAKAMKDGELDWLMREVFHVDGDDVYIAVSTYCTHFCCIPGYREAESLARPRNAWDNIFCTCHNSNYNHREPVTYTFSPEVVGGAEEGGFDPLLTRQAAAGGGGGH